MLRDRERRIFTDPAKVHPIRHEGRYFEVPGIHLCEPSPQRTPVLYQAGASSRGRRFAGRACRMRVRGVPVEGGAEEERGRYPGRASRRPGAIRATS